LKSRGGRRRNPNAPIEIQDGEIQDGTGPLFAGYRIVCRDNQPRSRKRRSDDRTNNDGTRRDNGKSASECHSWLLPKT
jgi:hypothetical protein